MDRKNLIKLLLCVPLLGSIACGRVETQSAKHENRDFLITDTSLVKTFDRVIGILNSDTDRCVFRLFIRNEPLLKSFIVMNSYSLDDLSAYPCMYYSTYKGFNVMVYTGVERYMPAQSIPERLHHFLNKEPRLYTYHSFQYDLDVLTGRDTFYTVQNNLYLLDPKPGKYKIESIK